MAASMSLAESGSKSWPMGVRPDRSRKHESTKTRRNQEPGLYLFLAARGQRETPLFGNGPLARWPKTPRSFSNELRQIAPQLRARGLSVRFDRTRKRRLIPITRDENFYDFSDTEESWV